MTDAPPAPTDDETATPGTAVEVAFAPAAPVSADVPDRNRWAEIELIARRLSRSLIVPKKFREERGTALAPEIVEASLVTVFLYAHDLGLSFTTAMNHINVIEGQPALSAQAQLGIVRARGHKVDAVEHKDEKGRTTGFTLNSTRADTGETLSTSFSISDAVGKKLCIVDDTKPNGVRARDRQDKPTPWELHTADMLWARCVTRMTRRGFSDVLSGLTFTAEELAPTYVWSETADQMDQEREPLTEDQKETLNERMRSLGDEGRKRAAVALNEAAGRGEVPHRMSEIGAGHFERVIAILDEVAATSTPPCETDASPDGIVDAEVVDPAHEAKDGDPVAAAAARLETLTGATPAAETESAEPSTDAEPSGDEGENLTCLACGKPVDPDSETAPYCADCTEPM